MIESVVALLMFVNAEIKEARLQVDGMARLRNKVPQQLNYFTVEENNNTNQNNEIKRRNRKRKMSNV
jgi:hypothetical protein